MLNHQELPTYLYFLRIDFYITKAFYTIKIGPKIYQARTDFMKKSEEKFTYFWLVQLSSDILMPMLLKICNSYVQNKTLFPIVKHLGTSLSLWNCDQRPNKKKKKYRVRRICLV